MLSGTSEFSAPSLSAFARDYLAGDLKPSLSSQAPPADDVTIPGRVRTLVGTTFAAVALDPHADVLVNFHAPWCAHCKTLEPVYEELAARLAAVPSVVVAKMDGTANEVCVCVCGCVCVRVCRCDAVPLAVVRMSVRAGARRSIFPTAPCAGTQP